MSACSKASMSPWASHAAGVSTAGRTSTRTTSCPSARSFRSCSRAPRSASARRPAMAGSGRVSCSSAAMVCARSAGTMPFSRIDSASGRVSTSQPMTRMEESGASPSRLASDVARPEPVGQASSVRRPVGSGRRRSPTRPAAMVVPMHPEIPATASVSPFIRLSRLASLLLPATSSSCTTTVAPGRQPPAPSPGAPCTRRWAFATLASGGCRPGRRRAGEGGQGGPARFCGCWGSGIHPTSMGESAGVDLHDLARSFGEVEAVRGVSLHIDEGETVGLLGPNGAGKTTTLSMLAALLAPSSGDAEIFGASLRRDALTVRRLVGLAPQEVSLYPELTADENLSFFGRLYGLGGARLMGRADELLDLVGLVPRRRDRVMTYSGVMKRRLNLACSLLHA